MTRHRAAALALAVLIALQIVPRAGADTPPELAVELLVEGLANPTIIVHAGDGSNRLFIGEQRGTVRIWDGSQLLPAIFLDLTGQITSGGERGLLGLAFAPDFAVSGTVYVHYSAPDTTGSPDVDHFSVVSRFQVSAGDPNQLDPTSQAIVLRYPQPYSNHNGGTIAFGPDGLLYIGLGDGGLGGDPDDRAQNLDVLLGKILRIDPQGDDFPSDADRNYSIPPSNPFVGAAGADEIWAYGLRNPWRFSFDRTTGDLFIGDVGQSAREEIDYQPAGSPGGENYGWRCYEGTLPYNLTGCGDPSAYVPPILEYSHAQGCSVTGGHRYRGSAYPNLAGTYLYGDYCTGVIWGATPEPGGWSSAPLLSSFLSISSFGEDEQGELYVADRLSPGGAVYRIVDDSPTDAVFADSFESGDTSAWSAVVP